MKSKTSFFNKAVFKKNMSMYWPIWALYLLYGLIKVPGMLWYFLQNRTLTDSVKYEALGKSLDPGTDIYVIALVAVICGMTLFGYLFTAKSANMIHALPTTRTELFFTNVFSGLALMVLPQIIVFLVTVVLCLNTGIVWLEYPFLWCLTVMGISFFVFSMVCFCAMLTGLLFALPVWFLVLNYLAVGLTVGVRYVVSFLGYGVNFSESPDIFFLRIFSPLNYIGNNVRMQTSFKYDEKGDYITTGMQFYGGSVVLGYAVAAIAIYLLAFYCYRKRKMECTGDLLTVGWMKPLLRWGFGICMGYLAGVMAANFLQAFFVGVPIRLLFVLVLLFGSIGFFVAEMFIEKSFRVFGGKRWKECGVFLLFAAISYGAIGGAAVQLQNYVPDPEQIDTVFLEADYPVEFEGENITEAIVIHQNILAKTETFRKECLDGENVVYVTLLYRLKNGKNMERYYPIPIGTDSSAEIADLIYQNEMEPEKFLRYMVGYDYDCIRDFEEAQIEYYLEENNLITHNIDRACTERLYEAVCRDVEEGSLQKYNIQNYMTGETNTYPTAYLYIYYEHNEEDWQDAYRRMNIGRDGDTYVEDESSKSGYLFISFGEDCSNIITELVKSGVIRSGEDLNFQIISVG